MAETNKFYMDKVDKILSNLSVSAIPNVLESKKDEEERDNFREYVLKNLPGEDVNQENLLNLKLKIEKKKIVNLL